MEIKSPIWIVLTVAFIVFVFIFFKRNKRKFRNGILISNTKYAKKSSYYQFLLKKYHFYMLFVIIVLSGALISTSFLGARIQSVKDNSETDYNRDIVLCLDVSSSMNQLNMSLVNQLRDVVKELKGDRFGISIFNASSITLVPLTKDYKYVDKILDTVSRSFNAQINGDSKTDRYIYNYVYRGTTEGDRGFSLIPDGLMSCGLSFREEDKDRTRVIILSTDNALAGTAVFTLDEVAHYLKDNNIILYGIGPQIMSGKNLLEYKDAVKVTHGKYFDAGASEMDSIVGEIDHLSKSAMEINQSNYRVDRPTSVFIILLLFITFIFLVCKKVEI